TSVLHRAAGTDAPVQAQMLASGGAGRGTAVAALVGLCLSGAGAGVYCATGRVSPAVDALAGARAPRTASARRDARPEPRPPPATTRPRRAAPGEFGGDSTSGGFGGGSGSGEFSP